jgi:hypothetical protein
MRFIAGWSLGDECVCHNKSFIHVSSASVDDPIAFFGYNSEMIQALCDFSFLFVGSFTKSQESANPLRQVGQSHSSE